MCQKEGSEASLFHTLSLPFRCSHLDERGPEDKGHVWMLECAITLVVVWSQFTMVALVTYNVVMCLVCVLIRFFQRNTDKCVCLCVCVLPCIRACMHTYTCLFKLLGIGSCHLKVWWTPNSLESGGKLSSGRWCCSLATEFFSLGKIPVVFFRPFDWLDETHPCYWHT